MFVYKSNGWRLTMYSHGWIFTLLSNRYFVQQCTRKCVKPMYYLIIERNKKPGFCEDLYWEHHGETKRTPCLLSFYHPVLLSCHRAYDPFFWTVIERERERFTVHNQNKDVSLNNKDHQKHKGRTNKSSEWEDVDYKSSYVQRSTPCSLSTANIT
jgi:hypothetical protein